jgi:glycosyltransferase involved in cell wall biosynthesis
MTRVLHLGNVANNGYINAKLLRRAGIEADALVDEWHILSQPEWEDAPLEGASHPLENLAIAAAHNGWHRPDWVIARRNWDPELAQQSWLAERLRIVAALPQIHRLYRRLRRDYEEVAEVQGTGPLRFMDVVLAWVWLKRMDQSFEPLSRLFLRYDVVQGYAIHPILSLLATPGRPFVAFEHGTMREEPFRDSWQGRLLALAYRRAAKIIITNPDVTVQAARLGLEDYVFIPHPIDEEKYTPGRAQLRPALEAEGFDFVLLCPSRHDWDIKGSDRLLRGFAELVRAERPHALLILCEWGLELDRSKALIRELGIERNVRWLDPLPKLRLIDAYRTADVVLDQFLIGTFGAVAPEAMSCGRPVVMAFDATHHAWCFPVLPPVIDARTPEQIYAALAGLAANGAERDRIGRAGRAWIEEHHSSRLVVERHLAIYADIEKQPPTAALTAP